jgi:hypothetical protein
MAGLSRTRSIGILHPRENFGATANLAINGAELVIDCHGCSTVALDLRGTFVANIELQGSCDGTNYELIPIRSRRGGAYGALVSNTAGLYVGECAGYEKVRARLIAYTSGVCVTSLIASNAVLDQSLMGAVTPLSVTATGAAGAAVTLTLPSPGAGLRQYVTYLRLVRFASAALVAAAAPVVVTTTNMSGALAFTLPADAAAQGTLSPYSEDYALPVAASAQNTNTTFVLPATPSVIWRATAGYYVAP